VVLHEVRHAEAHAEPGAVVRPMQQVFPSRQSALVAHSSAIVAGAAQAGAAVQT
jgi:hypothetical protein